MSTQSEESNWPLLSPLGLDVLLCLSFPLAGRKKVSSLLQLQ